MVKRISLALAFSLAAGFCWRGQAQTYETNNVVVQTFAGSAFTGYVDGQGTQTMFNGPSQIVSDTSSNLFVWDVVNARIRKITPSGFVSTFAGGGKYFPAYGTNAELFSALTSMMIDHSNVLFLAEYGRLIRIGVDRSVTPSTNLTDLVPESGICVDSGNNIYYTSYSGNRIFRYRTNGIVEVLAGSGNYGAIDGNGIFTSFGTPSKLVADAADNIYVWDLSTRLIRRINQNRDVVTIAGGIGSPMDGFGTNAAFGTVSQMCVDGSGNIIFACGSSIRKMSASTNVTTIAGSFTESGYTNGPGNLARFNSALGVCVAQGMIFVADFNNQRIRNITFNATEQQVSDSNLALSTYPGLRIVGVVGRTYRIESSPDMNTWHPETTLLLTASPYLWFDQNAIGQRKFYRALLLQ